MGPLRGPAAARLFLTYAWVLMEMLHTSPYRARAFESVDVCRRGICLHKERRKKYKELLCGVKKAATKGDSRGDGVEHTYLERFAVPELAPARQAGG